jgi:hypothetical protein
MLSTGKSFDEFVERVEAAVLAIRHRPPTTLRWRTPPETRQPLPVEALRQVWQDGAAMKESEDQFSLAAELRPQNRLRAVRQFGNVSIQQQPQDDAPAEGL